MCVRIYDKANRELVSCTKEVENTDRTLPKPAAEIPMPENVKTNEDLYLYGLHLEQYRHATFRPEDYYLEGLKRDSTDIRINNAYGMLMLKRGKFRTASEHFKTAIKKITRSNPNPYDSECFFNCGLAYKYLGEYDKAYDYFYKAVWSSAWQCAGFYQLACIDCMKHDYKAAMEHIEQSIIRNAHSIKSLNLKVMILKEASMYEEAEKLEEVIKKTDALDFMNSYEMGSADMKQLIQYYGYDAHTVIETGIDYMEAGFYKNALIIFSKYADSICSKEDVSPLIYYYMAFCIDKCRKTGEFIDEKYSSDEYIIYGEHAKPDYCFPHRLEDIIVLEFVISKNHDAAKAYYYLGNLWYDKRESEIAISCFERSYKIDSGFPTVCRNLALAYYNKKNDKEKAIEMLEKAYSLNKSDSRILMELNQLYRKVNIPLSRRYELLEKHMNQVKERDDLYLEYVNTLLELNKCKEAYEMLMQRKFHPWEGGEGKVPSAYVNCLAGLAADRMKNKDYEGALVYLKKAAGAYPANLGEGRLPQTMENRIYYYLGCVYEMLGDEKMSQKSYICAASGDCEPVSMMYYNDQPPENIYYQGEAFKKLNQPEKALERFEKLISYGRKHQNDKVKIDYFAVSLPDLFIFNDDLNLSNKIHCCNMMFLGWNGKNDYIKASYYEHKLKNLKPEHFGMRMFKLFSLNL